MKYAYIAGPVTGIRDYNLPAFEAARVLLRRHVERPRRIVIPHDLAEPGWSEAQAMSECLSFICETVDDGFDFTMVLLPGWRESLGTAVEVALARKLRVPVVELIGEELREVVP